MLKDNFIFFREFVKEFESTGSIVPTSRWAAQALISPLQNQNPRKAKRILEVGPGTGSVTLRILEAMLPEDELVLCEINPRLLAALKERLAKEPKFDGLARRISFFQGPIQDYADPKKFDVIVCAVPFLNLEAATVREIFEKLRTLSSQETVMTYYEYIWLRELGKIMSGKRKTRLQELEAYFESIRQQRVSRKPEWRNVPPIFIYTMRLAHDSRHHA